MPDQSPSIHDNFVYGYTVACEQRKIVLFTEYRDVADEADREFTDVIFTGVVAHHFEHVIESNILMSIDQADVEQVVNASSELFDRGWRYGWPRVEYRTREELVNKLRQTGVNAYEILGSLGLSGWVLAAAMELGARAGRATLP